MSLWVLVPRFALRGCSTLLKKREIVNVNSALRLCSSIASKAAATEMLLEKQKLEDAAQEDFTLIERKDGRDMPVVDMPNPYEKEKLQCILCKYGVDVDYKNVQLLSQFVSRHTGKVYAKHITGLCAAQQKLVEAEVAKARKAGLMPLGYKSLEFVDDPQIFDPYRPIKPHPY